MTLPSWRKYGKKLGVPLLLLAALYGMLRWFEHHQVYIPSRQLVWSPAESGWAFEDVHLTSADGVRVHGWFIPGDTNAPGSKATILLLHGNAGNIGHRFPTYEVLQQMGLSVFALDYRGYGRSEGRPSEAGTYLDAEAAYRWLRQKGIPAASIVALGESLGGGVASELALRQPLGGLVLQSTFTSIPEVGAELFPWLPVRWLSTIRYDTRAKLPRLHVPVLILHSRGDTLIRFHHAEANLSAARGPKRLYELLGDHNTALDSPAGREQFRQGLAAFLETLTLPPR